MRTPFSSRRRLVIAAAVILFAAIIGWFIFSSPPPGNLTFSFVGVMPGHSNTVSFWVTNSTRQLVQLNQLDVQTIRDGRWRTSSQIPAEVLIDSNVKPSRGSTSLVAPGEHGIIFIAQPTDTVWRAELLPISELKGFPALGAKVRVAFARRDLHFLHVHVIPWSIHTNFSDTITNAPPSR